MKGHGMTPSFLRNTLNKTRPAQRLCGSGFLLAFLLHVPFGQASEAAPAVPVLIAAAELTASADTGEPLGLSNSRELDAYGRATRHGSAAADRRRASDAPFAALGEAASRRSNCTKSSSACASADFPALKLSPTLSME
jgi:hypothetical protein